MTLLRLGPDALRASRFALSPLAETLSQLIRLRRPLDAPAPDASGAAFAGWMRADPFAEGLLSLLSSTKYLPDFVAIPPEGMQTRLEDELAQMAATSDADARATLAEARRFSWTTADPSWAQVDEVGSRAAAVFARGWAEHVQPHWRQYRAVMERDIRHRAGVIAVSGWRHALDGMARQLQWVGPDTIQFSTQAHPDRMIGDTGIVFVPHTGMAGQWACEAASRFALVYPARGALASHPAVGGGLTRLLGAGRAALIAELRLPATPSQLAAQLGLSLGTVSGHLAALRDAEVVVGRRSGRAVYYELTTTGERLVSLLGAPAT